jgi:hypothetical protein
MHGTGWLGLLGLLLAGCRAADSSPIPEAHADEPSNAGSGARSVVVELFTSEGCSSCPPADAVLADLASNPRVVALSLHVDYWDELGWPDPFSSPDNTAKQRAYASSFHTRGLYTPQLVVGGTDGFNGIDRGRATSDIAAVLGRPSPAAVRVSAHATQNGWIDVEAQASDAPANAVMNVALVQRAATSQVRAGENAGRTLRHVDVVRAFASRAANAPGTIPVKMPAGLRREDVAVVAFVQLPSGGSAGMPILGAARADVGP